MGRDLILVNSSQFVSYQCTRDFYRLITYSAPRRMMGSSATQSVGAYTPPSFKQTWLSDPATYPIMFILGVATVGCSAFMTYKFSTGMNFRISPSTKGQTLRTWGGRDMRGNVIKPDM
jgi:hypothetical protein